MNHYLESFSQREEAIRLARLQGCRLVATRALAKLKEVGIEAILVGSIARNEPRATSDIDILILNQSNQASQSAGFAPLSKEEIFLLVEKEAYLVDKEIPVDVLFADDLDPKFLAFVLSDSAPRDVQISGVQVKRHEEPSEVSLCLAR